MITYILGNFFTSPASTLVNTVNTVGVMGKGIAKVFRDAFPEMFADYKHVCQRGLFSIGDLMLYPTLHKTFLNFPTKTDWRRPSRLEYIEAGLRTFSATYASHGLTSVAFPQLGCGNGGLNWEHQVRPLMESILAPLPIETYIHIYDGQDHLPIGWDATQTRRWLQSTVVPTTGDTVWRELFRLVASRRDNDVDAFTSISAWHERETEALLIQRRQDALIWIRDDFVEWWTSIGGRGIVTAPQVEGIADGYGDLLMSLFADLPHAHRICLAESPGHSTPIEWDAGIQLLPSTATEERIRVSVNGVESNAGRALTQSLLPLSASSHAA
jgi:O-acetyl-ADP-ribose deacetylase (regulator of RNase III)